MIRRNLFYKLLALGVAIVLWVYVNAERNPQSQKTLAVPVQVRNLAKGYVADLAVREAAVTISGLKTVVDSVGKEDVKVWIDAKVTIDGSAARKVLPVKWTIARVEPDELDVAVKPKTVNVTIESVSSKRLPVEVKYVSALPLGYSRSNQEIIPASVKVFGKSVLVAKVNRVILTLAEKTLIGPIDDYFSVSPLDSRGNTVSGVDLMPDKVQLKLEIVEVPATKSVFVSPNVVGEPKYPATVTRISVSPTSVTLEGKPTELAGVSTVTTDRISINDAETNITREVALRLPPGVKAVDRTAVRVTVHIASPTE